MLWTMMWERTPQQAEGWAAAVINEGLSEMPKGRYHEWLQPDNSILLQGWARDGLTDAQIAGKIGINVATLYEWKKRYPKINDALKKGKEVVDYAVESALLKKALSGDTTAMIFWLKNRRPDKWRDKPEATGEGELLTAARRLLDSVDSAID